MKKFQRILVPTDFSDCAEEAVRYAADLPLAEGGELVLVHAIEPTVYPIHQVIKRIDDLSVENQVRRTCEDHLDALSSSIEGVEVRWILREGHAASEVCRAAADEDADLVVIATHGHTGLKHMLLGSTAEVVVRKAPCPVLTVRPKASKS